MRPVLILGVVLVLGTGAPSVAAADDIKPINETLSAGFSHTCAIVSTGIQCAGANDTGQLGNGTIDETGFGASPNPTDVEGLSGRPAAVVGGLLHTCALSTTGGVSCWGNNFYGQLGTGDRTDSDVPRASLMTGARSIDLGNSHTCAVTTGGTVMCWGLNENGELGNGEPGCQDKCFSTHPTQVAGLSGVRQVALADNFSCAVTKAGAVFCWGENFGPRPKPVPGLGDDVYAISVGIGHACARTEARAVKCWGDGAFGELGNGRHGPGYRSDRAVTAVERGAVALAAGGDHTCIVTKTGAVGCWGRNDYGELGDGTTKDRDEVVGVANLNAGSGVTEISVGYQFSCAAFGGDDVRCWGKNQMGQLGDGTTEDRHTPHQSNFGGPSVSFVVHANGRQALKGKGHRFELTKITGFGTVWLDSLPVGNANIVSGTGRFRVHRWRIFEHGTVDEDDFTAEVIGRAASWEVFPAAEAVSGLRVRVTRSDSTAKDECPRGRTGTISFLDGPPDVIDIDICGFEERIVPRKGKGISVQVAVALEPQSRPGAA